MDNAGVVTVAVATFLAGIVFAGGLAALAGVRAHLEPYPLPTSAYELANGQPDWICKYWSGAHGRGWRRQECTPIPAGDTARPKQGEQAARENAPKSPPEAR